MRMQFDEQLKELNHKLIEMGSLIETAITRSIEALNHHDVELAKKVVDFDDEVNQKEKDIEAFCLKLLLHQQPVAKDLRLISSALKMITDMERIGDQAADIAEITIFLAENQYIKKLEHIPLMAEAAIKMVTESIDAFIKMDLDLAMEVIAYDDVVDDLFRTIKSELIDLIHADRANGEQALDLLMISKYLERIGDNAQNIAEWVVFSITGMHVQSES